ncbi:MAG TPA: hypothetical protein PK073_09500 [Ignavibacteriaceae bacterium]|jgi:hypothetical protein|nr:MAG: hypothetical protein BWY38_02061 [Ignavibacteria bacterium ADurb.Bin266]HQF43135.1 hypothetical protein [Ignavibacteriaceae bacterium]HQI40951.1 hypothetical protein [Ignavibacteriaceae bacterium]
MKHFLLFVLFLFLCNRLTEAQQILTFADPPRPENVIVVYKAPASKDDTVSFSLFL